MKKIVSLLMLMTLIMPLCMNGMNAPVLENDENPEIIDAAQDPAENPAEQEEPEENQAEPAPQPNQNRLARMQAMQARFRGIARRVAQNNPEEQQFEHECPVCRDAEAAIVLPCNHRMCRACLTQWASTQEIHTGYAVALFRVIGQPHQAANTCPECRAAIPDAFIRQELTDNISRLQKAQLRLSLVGKGFLNGLFWGSTFKKTLHWWRSPYLEKTAGLGNTMFTFILSMPTSGVLMAHEMRRLNPELMAGQIMMRNPDNEDVQRIFWKHTKRWFTINRIVSTGLMLKTKNRSLIRNTLHTNMLFPSLAVAESAIPYLNKGYEYKLCSRTASKGWSTLGTCLGLYCTNRVYNAYNNWGSRLLTRAGIAA